MAKSFYSHIRDAWKDPDDGKLAELQWQRKQDWRKQGAIERIDRPTDSTAPARSATRPSRASSWHA